jgi:hypothetical protein
MTTLTNLDLIAGFIEIEPVGSDAFFKIKETLTRIRSGKQERRRL